MDKWSVLYLSWINKASNKIATARDLGKEEVLAEGLEKGKEECIAEGKLETARKMLADGLSIYIVAKYTDLSEEVISKI